MTLAQHGDSSRWVVLAGACLGVFSLTMNGTALITAIPVIRHEFDIGPTTLQWIVTIYFLTGAVFLAAAGRIGDRFGLGRVFLSGTLCFALAYALIALAPDAGIVLLGRAIQGLAGALLLPMSLALVKAAFPEAEHHRAAGIWSGVLVLGLGIGPIVGGLLTHYVDWRAIFWVGTVLVFASFAITLMALRGRLKPRSKVQAAAQGDYLGFGLLALCMGAFTFAITHAEQLGWQSRVTVSMLFVAVGSFVALLVRERRAAKPFLDIALFRNRYFVAATLGILSTFFLVYSLLYFISIFIQNPLTLGYMPDRAGFTLVSLTVVMFVVSLFVHRATAHFGARFVVTTGLGLITLGTMMLYAEVAGLSVFGLEVALVVCGTGLGLTVPVFSGIGLATLPSGQTGQGAGLLTTSTFLGATVGISVSGLVAARASRSTLEAGLAANEGLPLGQSADFLSGLHATPVELDALLGQFDAPTARALETLLTQAVDAGFASVTLLCVVIAAAGAAAQYLLLKGPKSLVTGRSATVKPPP